MWAEVQHHYHAPRCCPLLVGAPHVQGLQERLIVCTGAFVIVLGLFRLLFCRSCTRREGGWSPALSCPGSHPTCSSLHCPWCGYRPIHAESSPMSKWTNVVRSSMVLLTYMKVLGRSGGETQCPGSPGFQALSGAVRLHTVVVVPKSKD